MGGLEEENNMDDSKRAERKFKKHMVEKRRRNRINYALDQLKMMVLEGLDKDPTKYDKMEKADILDLTVKYLHRILKENIHFGPEMMQSLPPMFSEHFAGGFFHHPQLPPPLGILPDPCPSSGILEEPLDLHGRGMASQHSVSASQSSMTSRSNVTSQSRAESPCIDVDSDSDDSDGEDDIIRVDSVKSDTVKGFQPVKKHTDSTHTSSKRSLYMDREMSDPSTKRSRLEDPNSISKNISSAYPSIKLNITGQTLSAFDNKDISKPGPSIVRPVATVPRLSLRTDTNMKTFPTLPYPSHPFSAVGAPMVRLPIMHSDLSWRPW
uniref:Hairy enhancer of split 11 n=1 Tax=Platynereis dumerilii TaxID=6359 RepID=S5TYU1_PLADU|nr:hairy enhancer of split 11 [Platynereis dumerilii]